MNKITLTENQLVGLIKKCITENSVWTSFIFDERYKYNKAYKFVADTLCSILESWNTMLERFKSGEVNKKQATQMFLCDAGLLVGYDPKEHIPIFKDFVQYICELIKTNGFTLDDFESLLWLKPFSLINYKHIKKVFDMMQ